MSKRAVIFPPPPHVQLFMAFDFGLKRTGVAIASRSLKTASPLGCIVAEGRAKFSVVAEKIKAWQPHALVVGVPYHPDGNSHDNTALAQQFARQLDGRFLLPVYEVDERYSTLDAMARYDNNAADLDAQSACVILEQFLRSFE